MTLPKPDRYTYFPPPSIFGTQIVSVYIAGFGPAIPFDQVVQALGITTAQATKIIDKNVDSLDLYDCTTKKLLAGKANPSSVKGLCLGMDAIGMLIMNTDHTQMKDKLAAQRIAVAKQWIMAQISNRIKIPGQKHQPRWDSGLTKEQAKKMRAQLKSLASANAKAKPKSRAK